MMPNSSVSYTLLQNVGNQSLTPEAVNVDAWLQQVGSWNPVAVDVENGPVFVLASTVCSILVIKGLQSINSGSPALFCAGAVLVAIAGILTRDNQLVDASPETSMAHIHFAAVSGFVGAVGVNLLIIVYLVFFQVDYVRVPGFGVMCIKKTVEGLGEPCIKLSEQKLDFPTWFFGQTTGIYTWNVGSCIALWATTWWYADLIRPWSWIMVLSCAAHLICRTVLGRLNDRGFAMQAIAPVSLSVGICTLLLVCTTRNVHSHVEAVAVVDAWVALHVTIPVYGFYLGMNVVNMGASSILKLSHMTLLLATCWKIFLSVPASDSVVPPNIGYAMLAGAAAFACGWAIGAWGQTDAKYFWELEAGVLDIETLPVDQKSISSSSVSGFARGTGVGACDETTRGDLLQLDFNGLLTMRGGKRHFDPSLSDDPSSGDHASSEGNPSSSGDASSDESLWISVSSSGPESDGCESPPPKKKPRSAKIEEKAYDPIQDVTTLGSFCDANPAYENQACVTTAWDEEKAVFEQSLKMLQGTGYSVPFLDRNLSPGDDASSGGDCGLDPVSLPDGKSESALGVKPDFTPGVAVIHSTTGTILTCDGAFQQICSSLGGGNLPDGFVQMQGMAVNIAVRFQWINATNGHSMNMLPVHVDVPADCPRISISGNAVWMQGAEPTILWTIEEWSPIPEYDAMGMAANVTAHVRPGAYKAPNVANMANLEGTPAWMAPSHNVADLKGTSEWMPLTWMAPSLNAADLKINSGWMNVANHKATSEWMATSRLQTEQTAPSQLKKNKSVNSRARFTGFELIFEEHGSHGVKKIRNPKRH